MVARLVCYHAQKMQGIGISRIKRQNFPIDRLRFWQTTCPMVRHAGLDRLRNIKRIRNPLTAVGSQWDVLAWQAAAFIFLATATRAWIVSSDIIQNGSAMLVIPVMRDFLSSTCYRTASRNASCILTITSSQSPGSCCRNYGLLFENGMFWATGGGFV